MFGRSNPEFHSQHTQYSCMSNKRNSVHMFLERHLKSKAHMLGSCWQHNLDCIVVLEFEETILVRVLEVGQGKKKGAGFWA